MVDGNGGSIRGQPELQPGGGQRRTDRIGHCRPGNGTEDTAYTVSAVDLLAGFSDVDGDTLSVSALDQQQWQRHRQRQWHLHHHPECELQRRGEPELQRGRRQRRQRRSQPELQPGGGQRRTDRIGHVPPSQAAQKIPLTPSAPSTCWPASAMWMATR